MPAFAAILAPLAGAFALFFLPNEPTHADHPAWNPQSVASFILAPSPNTNDPPTYFDANGQALPPPQPGYDGNDRLVGCNGIALGAETLCSCFEYDKDGRQVGVVQPGGTVTRSDFDGLARLRLTIENATAESADDRRLTAYDYDDKGRLAAMAAVLPGHNNGNGGVHEYTDINWSALDATIQITTFLYDAPVLDKSRGAVNVNPAWIKAVHYAPRPSVAGAVLEFAYYMDGAVATREDARGCKFTYKYDELGRLTQTLADDKPWYDPVNQGEPTYAPSPRVHEITYAYTSDGQLSLVTARSDPNNALSIIAQNQYDYDARRNLLWERQSHNAPVDPNNSPKVEYTWTWNGLDPNDPSDTLQFDRLASMVYPARPDGGTTRAVTLNYGDNAGGVDSRASRITSIADNLIGGSSVASYAYAGLSRRISSALGNGATQSYRTGGEADAGYAGLDRFGRVADLHVKDSTQGGAGLTLRRDLYGYDRAGNRIYDRVTQRKPNVANQTWDNVRSWLYEYDGLQRLVDAHMGQLNSTNTAIFDPDNGTVPLRRKMTWNLDNLSNWSGGTVANGSFIRSDDTDNDQGWEVESKIHHQVDRFNRITEVDLNGNVNADTVNDIAGNLVFDQDYFYQYDAWGRLVQVNRMLGMTAADFDGEGRLLGSAAGHVGDLVAHYTYDGLGRLVVKTVLTAPGSSTKQHQHHYYDGVRRVQEQFHTESSGGGGTWTTRREYLHGPDYVDEYVLQVHNPACDGGGGGGDTTGHCGPDSAQVVYMLQDANYNVVATLDGGASTGCGGGSGGSGCGGGGDGSGGGGANEIGVYEQYTHEPYGQLAALDKFITTPPQNLAGHQGLFYDHYCATSPSAPCLQVAHKGLYQNRNRFYHPKLGRFTTPDPNSSAIPLIEGASYHGAPLSALATVGSGAISRYSPQGQFGNGSNLYGYVGANPIAAMDALGLEWDWDDELDEQISDRTAHALYALGTLNESARIASLGLQTAVGIAQGFLPGSGLYDAFESVKVIASGKGGFWDAVNIAAVALPGLAKAGKIIGGVAAGGLAAKALGKVAVWRRRASGTTRLVGRFADWLNSGRKNTQVYIGYKNGRAVYVGISGEIATRASKHGKRFDELRPIASNLTEHQARAVEQVLIESNWTRFENINQSIKFENEFYDDAATWALEWMSDHGVPSIWN